MCTKSGAGLALEAMRLVPQSVGLARLAPGLPVDKQIKTTQTPVRRPSGLDCQMWVLVLGSSSMFHCLLAVACWVGLGPRAGLGWALRLRLRPWLVCCMRPVEVEAASSKEGGGRGGGDASR
jgi:hypothetical protein